MLLVPAFSSLHCQLDCNLGHYRRYDKVPFLRRLETVGFNISHCSNLNMLGAVGWFVNGKILGRGMMPKRQMRLFNKLTWMLDLERFLGPPFGLSLLVVAEKP